MLRKYLSKTSWATETEMSFHALRGLVMEYIGKPSHPIVVGGSDSANL